MSEDVLDERDAPLLEGDYTVAGEQQDDGHGQPGEECPFSEAQLAYLEQHYVPREEHEAAIEARDERIAALASELEAERNGSREQPADGDQDHNESAAESTVTWRMQDEGLSITELVAEYEGREFNLGLQLDRIDELEESIPEESAEEPSDDEETIAVDADGAAPARSALDFYANCYTPNVKEAYCVKRNRQNTYRAIQAVKYWQDFAQVSADGEKVLWTRDALETALAAVLGDSPHEQTISRVWDILKRIGQDDVVEKRHCISNKQSAQDVLKMDREAAEALLDQRYVDERPLSDGITAITDVVSTTTAVGV